jgi:hypothetical protein
MPGYPWKEERRGPPCLHQSLTYTAADSFKERIVHIRFQDLAYQHRVARGFISVIYGLGITALAIPTLHTFGAIITSALRFANSICCHPSFSAI